MAEQHRTVEDVLRDCRVTFSARTRYVGQEPRDDELLVAEIERLRSELAEAEAALEETHQWLTNRPNRR